MRRHHLIDILATSRLSACWTSIIGGSWVEELSRATWSTIGAWERQGTRSICVLLKSIMDFAHREECSVCVRQVVDVRNLYLDAVS
jgi:hypothetical protein